MSRMLVVLLIFLAVAIPAQAAQEFQQEQLFTPYNQSGYTWGNTGFERYLWLGSYKITDRNQGSYLVTKDTEYSAYVCELSTGGGPPAYFGCSYYKASLNANTAKYELTLSESGVAMANVYFGTMKEVTEPPPVDPGDGGGTDPGGGGDVGGALPDYNFFDESTMSKFWSYMQSALKLGMPMLLIILAIIVLELVLVELIIKTWKKARNRKDDDDDW
jgi:hypothetical protein